MEGNARARRRVPNDVAARRVLRILEAKHIRNPRFHSLARTESNRNTAKTRSESIVRRERFPPENRRNLRLGAFRQNLVLAPLQIAELDFVDFAERVEIKRKPRPGGRRFGNRSCRKKTDQNGENAGTE